MLDDSVVPTGRMKRSKRGRIRDRSFTTQEQRLIMAAAVGRFNMPGRLDSPAGWFMINRRSMPPSSSGLGYLVLSQGTGVRVPVGVLSGPVVHAIGRLHCVQRPSQHLGS